MRSKIIFCSQRTASASNDIGGWADRLKGIIFCNIIARLNCSEFYVQWNADESVPPALNPRFIISNFSIVSGLSRSFDLIDKSPEEVSHAIREIFNDFSQKRNFIINANSINFDCLYHYKDKICKIYSVPEWRVELLFEHVYQHVCAGQSKRFSGNLLIKQFKSFKSSYDLVLGAHMRCGGWGSWKDPVLDLPSNAIYLARAVKKTLDAIEHSRCAIYLASDNEHAKSVFIEEFPYPESCFFGCDKVVHIDRSLDVSESETLTVFSEHFSLSMCDCVIHGEGDFAVSAAMSSGIPKIKYHDIICLPTSRRLLLSLMKSLRKDRRGTWERMVRKFKRKLPGYSPHL